MKIGEILGIMPGGPHTFSVGQMVTGAGEDSIAHELEGEEFEVTEVSDVPCTCGSNSEPGGYHGELCDVLAVLHHQLVTVEVEGKPREYSGSLLMPLPNLGEALGVE